ncbi:MAG: hypothetical protein WBW14_05895, partial [Candidatus Acidiferrum sp.]
PANILATSGGVVKLLDFGLAKQNHDSLTDNETQSIGITQVGTIMGTPAYMSPEQAEGKLADARSDIYVLQLVSGADGAKRSGYCGSQAGTASRSTLRIRGLQRGSGSGVCTTLGSGD